MAGGRFSQSSFESDRHVLAPGGATAGQQPDPRDSGRRRQRAE